MTALAAISVTHCSACSSPTHTDAGLDANIATDAASDQRADAPIAVTDVTDENLTAPCTQVSDTPERWQRLPFACDCDARIALQPDAAAPPLRWTPCADHAGASISCFDLEADWRSPESASAMFEFVGREVDGALYVFYRRAHDGTRRDRFILSRIDGPPLVAWDTAAFSRENAPCVATPIDGPVFGLTLWWSPTDSTFRNYVSIGTPSNGPEWRTPVVNFLGAPWDRALIPYVSGYGRDVALSLGPTLWRSAPESREFVALAHGAALQGTIEAVQLHGEQSWFLLTQVDRSSVSQTNTSLAVVEARRPPQVVYRPSPARTLGYVLADDQIVLAESEPSLDRLGPTVIRVAQRTTDPALFAPRDLWRVPSDRTPLLRDSVVAAGWLALVTRMNNGAEQRLVLVRLSDGARYEPGAEAAPHKIAYVTRDEVAFAHRAPGRGISIRRIAIRSLGALLPASR